MKKLVTATAALTLIICIYSIGQQFLSFQNQTNSAAVSAIQKIPAATTSKNQWLVPRLNQDENVTPPLSKNSEEKPVAKECLDFMTDIQRMSLDALKFPPQALALPPSTGCEYWPMGMDVKVKALFEKCDALKSALAAGEAATSENDWSKQSAECLQSLFFLRGSITAWQTRDLDLDQITDMRLLTDRLAASFSDILSAGNNPETKSIIALGERMLQVDPHSYAGIQAALMGYAIESFHDRTLWNDQTRLKRFNELVNLATAARPQDAGNQATRQILMTKGFDPIETRRVMREELNRNPHSAPAHFGLAWAIYKIDGNSSAAVARVQQALRLDPNNDEYRTALNNLRNNPRPDSFKRSVQLGIMFENLYN